MRISSHPRETLTLLAAEGKTAWGDSPSAMAWLELSASKGDDDAVEELDALRKAKDRLG